MNPGVDVAAPLTIDRVVRHHDAHCIHDLHGALGGCHKLGLARAESDTPLTLGSPQQRGAIQAHDVACHQLASVRVGGEITIHPTLKTVASSLVQALVREPLIIGAHNVLKHQLCRPHVLDPRIRYELRQLCVGEG
eukprot:3161934-Rhodomonas_salina.1